MFCLCVWTEIHLQTQSKKQRKRETVKRSRLKHLKIIVRNLVSNFLNKKKNQNTIKHALIYYYSILLLFSFYVLGHVIYKKNQRKKWTNLIFTPNVRCFLLFFFSNRSLGKKLDQKPIEEKKMVVLTFIGFHWILKWKLLL